MSKIYIYLFLFLKLIIANTYLNAEPFVVLQYNNLSELSDRQNDFAQNPDYSNKHTIMPGESLNLIIQKYYDGSGLNTHFLQLAIVSLNKHAFRNRNINYMIADETIHLPSINQISKLMKGIDFELEEEISYLQNNIYYFGG
tara:strand:+ start:2093 stop:2518 length:426 start_codon:yes stop_codon:yes gene_type:complete